MSYCPNTPEDIREMLAAIGKGSIEELFEPIHHTLRAKSFNLPAGISEQELLVKMQELAACDRHLINFIGGGYYDHHIPAVVDHLSGRAEFYTAYTPYQPECSQGTLQALFEYQTAICRLTGMEVSNASLYDGGTALAEAAMMALRITGRNRVVIDASVNPFARQIVATYMKNLGVEMVEIPTSSGSADRSALTEALTRDVAAVMVQNPNFFGSIEDLTAISQAAHAKGALLVTSVYPISLGLIKSPGEMGADIVVGDGQSWAIPSPLAVPPSVSLPPRKNISATCLAASSARPSTRKAAAASFLHCRPGSSTSRGTRPPPTSAATRASVPCVALFFSPASARRGWRNWPISTGTRLNTPRKDWAPSGG